MKITNLKNNITDSLTYNAGISVTKSLLKSISFPVEMTEKTTDKGFSAEYIDNSTGKGNFIIGEQILAEVDGSEDIAFLIFSNEGMNPQPLKPFHNNMKKGKATACQMCEQWYGVPSGSYPQVFADFYLHEMCHAMYFLLGKGNEDITHYQGNYPEWANKQNSEWYLHLILTLVPAWNAYSSGIIIAPRTLKQGMKGDDVKQLQIDLNQITKPSIPLVVDGDFGGKTFWAVKSFQTKYGLVSDGIVGPKTKEKIAEKKTKKSLIEAIIQVESGGNVNAIGDKNLKFPAYGCMQIRQPACVDVNNKFGTHYKSIDCLGNRELSIYIFNKYMECYPKNITDEDKARAWNGGGNWKLIYGKSGHEKYSKALDVYWNKVKTLLV